MARLDFINPKTAPTLHPTTLDIAWAAGIYEGEGCVTKDKRANGFGRGLILQVAQKDPYILHKLCALFGGSIRKLRAGSKPVICSQWALCGPRAHGFLMTIFTFLSPRRRQQALSAIAARS